MDEDADDTLELVKMGADNNPNATSHLVLLQTRKQALEEKIVTKNKELRNLCIQEAELTGVLPAEIPLEPGETLPTFRRRVGTAFEYPENIVNNELSHEDSIPALETQIQVQKKIAEAALQLANNVTISKFIKRKNMQMYRQTKTQLEHLEERLVALRLQGQSNSQNQQLKQKKKPRPPLDSDTISTKNSNLSQNEESHSAHNVTRPESTNFSQDVVDNEPRYMIADKYNNIMYKNPNLYVLESEIHNANNPNYNMTAEDDLKRLSSINSYSSAKDRRSSESSNCNQYPSNIYNNFHSNPNISQPPILISNSHTLPHLSNISSPSQQYQQPTTSHPNLNFLNHSYTLHHPNSRVRYYPDNHSGKYTNDNFRNNSYNQESNYPYYPSHAYTMYPNMMPQSYGAKQKPYGGYVETSNYSNVMVNQHHIMPHQQYETADGLGGHWMKTENGEMVWCPTAPHDESPSNTWPTDKRFGSLDRRKGKLLQKHVSPDLIDTVHQQSTLRSVTNSQQELANRQIHIQSPVPVAATTIRSSRHDNRQLVRTQSLGSVGGQIVDNVWPSDDNSSYDSDGHSVNELNANSRKLKQKGWCETSLDSPSLVPTIPQNITSQESRNSVQVPPLSPQPSILLSPRTPKPILEIPAESNPSPMMTRLETELYKNNILTDIPKNCTVVQAGQCKPYREVTKPFEMSDFYKYSTKFREKNHEKSPTTDGEYVMVSRTKEGTGRFVGTPSDLVSHQRTSDQCDGHEETDDVFQKGVYLPLAPMKCQPLSPTNSGSENFNISSLNTSLTLNTSNVAEHFSAEMNAWYQVHGQPELHNNNAERSPVSIRRSTATLV